MEEQILRLPAEQLFQNEIDALIAAEKHPVPAGWNMSHKCELKQAILVKLLYGTRYSGFFGTVFFLTNNVNTFYL